MSTCYSLTPAARTALAVTLCTPLARVTLAAIRRESESRCVARLGHPYEVRAADRALPSIRYTAASGLTLADARKRARELAQSNARMVVSIYDTRTRQAVA